MAPGVDPLGAFWDGAVAPDVGLDVDEPEGVEPDVGLDVVLDETIWVG